MYIDRLHIEQTAPYWQSQQVAADNSRTLLILQVQFPVNFRIGVEGVLYLPGAGNGSVGRQSQKPHLAVAFAHLAFLITGFRIDTQEARHGGAPAFTTRDKHGSQGELGTPLIGVFTGGHLHR